MYFPPYTNSLVADMMMRFKPPNMGDREREKSSLGELANKNLSLISGLYLYTGTPPHGYGTQAPKVAETVKRAYSFNLKKINKEQKIGDLVIERMHWEKADGGFPFGEIHGNFIPSEARKMAEEFIIKNQPYIDGCVEETMRKVLDTNSDMLTKGRQTFCPFTNQSVTAAVAYKRMYEFLTVNTGKQCLSCLEWIQAFFELFEKPTIRYSTMKWEEVDRATFLRSTKQRVIVKRKIRKRVTIETKSIEETRQVLLMLSTRFASYIKQKERGKKDRRAIASANMMLRMFLHIIEEFHLRLSEKIEGATISIGGEEKKQKIANNISSATLKSCPADAICQGTEDATKWNECLAPSLFGLMHYYLFDEDTRIRVCKPLPSVLGKLFSSIAMAGNFLMSLKEIQLGKGVIVTNKNEYSRIQWCDEWVKAMNSDTKRWFEEVKTRVTGEGEYLKASPGMLMGMLNAGSTTVGLLAPNHRMDQNEIRVLTLRSSDDSMSIYMGMSAGAVKKCVEMNKRNLEMLGINLSNDKTFFFREGLGEYTSWYCDRTFISQFGTETASIRPKGVNPQDDFYSIAKETSTALSTLTINHLGAAVRLRLGVDGTRRLWRVKEQLGKRNGVSDSVQLLADGGSQPWNCANCHLEETSLRELKATTQEEKDYLLRIRNPENPFSTEKEEELTYSKEHGRLVMDIIETPRTCFSFLKKSNRTFKREEKREEEANEKSNAEAAKIISLVDPTTLVNYPSTTGVISSHLSSVMRLEKEGLNLSEEENAIVERALDVLEKGDYSLLWGEDQDEFDYEEFLGNRDENIDY